MSQTANVIEKAVSSNLYFTELGGNLTTQDLYHLPLSQLDELYRALKAQDKKEDSLLESTTEADRVLSLKIAVVTRVVRSRQAAIERAEQAEQRNQKKEFLKGLIEQKKIEDMKDMSIEELQAQIEEL